MYSDDWKRIEDMFNAINEAIEHTIPDYIVLVDIPIDCYEDDTKGYNQVTPIYLN